MSNRSWKSGRKQPSQQREAQKEPKKKTLEDACKDIKKNLAAECQARVSAVKQAEALREEEEQMALIYGPNWKQGLPKWALAQNRTRIDEIQEEQYPETPDSLSKYDDYDDEGERGVIPFPRKSETRIKQRKAS